MKNNTLVAIAFLFMFTARAQDSASSGGLNPRTKPPREPWYTRLVYGGNVGLQFGNATLVDVSPIVGYRVTERLVPAVGITYQYINIRFNNGQRYINTIYGCSGILRYYFLDNLYGHAEYQKLNGQWFPWQQNERYWITGLLVGGGYRQMLGANVGLGLTVLWNLYDTPEWPYQNPIVRLGVGVGF
ncbi:MAG: hypothetical protein FD123_3845 [Bacteroidetes bacterium]|nr:MAG: hypothetical protein FD123_3845 [Bacteroidota bacterium]